MNWSPRSLHSALGSLDHAVSEYLARRLKTSPKPGGSNQQEPNASSFAPLGERAAGQTGPEPSAHSLARPIAEARESKLDGKPSLTRQSGDWQQMLGARNKAKMRQDVHLGAANSINSEAFQNVRDQRFGKIATQAL
jgi:hypothetical protein